MLEKLQIKDGKLFWYLISCMLAGSIIGLSDLSTSWAILVLILTLFLYNMIFRFITPYPKNDHN